MTDIIIKGIIKKVVYRRGLLAVCSMLVPVVGDDSLASAEFNC
jgi:hypothetical protein